MMNKQAKNFMDFVRSQGVVGLAVGLAIGAQVSVVVKSIVENLINPVIGFIVGDSKGLEKLSFTVDAGSRSMSIGWGAVVSSLITLIAISAVIYYVITGFKLDKLDKKPEK